MGYICIGIGTVQHAFYSFVYILKVDSVEIISKPFGKRTEIKLLLLSDIKSFENMPN